MHARNAAAFAFTVLGTISCAAARSPLVSGFPRALTASDTGTRLAITDALKYFRPHRGRIILTSPDGRLSAAGVPNTSEWILVILSRDELQRFADDSGDLSYVQVFPAAIVGDTALVDISLESARSRSRREGQLVMGGASACTWLAVKRSHGWVLAGRRTCFILD